MFFSKQADLLILEFITDGAILKLAQLTPEFCKRKVKYVRHILSEAGIVIDQQKTEKVVN
jgi:hypothetical protein